MLAGRSRAFLLLFITAVGLPLLAAQVRLAAPSYQDPGSGQWASWAKPGSPAVGIMIVNLNNGNDETYYPSVDNAIRQARRQGILVIGYTYTGYGTRSPKVVRSKIDAVYRNYLVDGIFFDEVPTDCHAGNPYQPSEFLYYQELTNYVRQKSGARIAVLNLGTYSPDDCWMGIANILMNWEDLGLDNYRTNYVDFAWVHQYPPDRFWHIVYGMPANGIAAALELAKRRNAGWVYLTDETGNPYAAPPTYWAAEASAAEQQPVQAPFATAWPNSEDENGLPLRGQVSLRWSSAVGSRWQVFFDADQNAKTGYHGGGLAVGAEYLLQADASGASLSRYTGSGLDWNWTEVSAHAQFGSLDPNVFSASFDTTGLGGTKTVNYQVRGLDTSGNTVGDSYVLPVSLTNTGMVFDMQNHP